MEDFFTRLWNTERIYMVDFSRALTGAPHRRYPEVDDVGYHDDAFPDEHGPIVSAMVGQTNVKVRVHRTEISTKATLFVVAEDDEIVKITDPLVCLNEDRSQDIEFTAAKPGRTAIEIRYNWDDGPIVGKLYVQVYERIVIRLRVHIVSIVQRDDKGNIVAQKAEPALFFGKSCPTKADKLLCLQELVYLADEIWIPHGIAFIIDDIYETEWGSNELGKTTTDPGDLELMRAGALEPRRSAAHINLYVLPSLDASGVTIHPRRKVLFNDRAGIPHNCCGVYLNSDVDYDTSGHVIAHELGHYMGLCADKEKHSTSDTSSWQLRDDSVSRRRVMYPVDRFWPTGKSTPWRDDVGYGDLTCGGLFTHRRLPAAQDLTFEESQRARNFALAPGFFAF